MHSNNQWMNAGNAIKLTLTKESEIKDDDEKL